MTDEQKDAVERWVNEAIQKDLSVSYEEMDTKAAQNSGAIGVFGDRYDEVVKVYTIGDEGSHVSREICGGPHVGTTGELGVFRIVKEESVAAGIRRIKAVLE